jgi:hypothetical protein
MLRNEIYTGIVPQKDGMPSVKGQFEPLVSVREFNRVQAVLEGNLALCVEHQRDREEFPLRRFVRCGVCGSTLTASDRKKSQTTTYAYYWCWKHRCKDVSIPAEVLERTFLEYLDELTPHPRLLDFLDAIIIDRRQARVDEQRQAKKEAGRTQRNVGEYIDKLTSKFVEDRIPEEDYRRQRQAAEVRLRELSSVINQPEFTTLETRKIMESARKVLATPRRIWEDAGAQRRRQLQKALFPSGVVYLPDKGLATPLSPKGFNLLRLREIPDLKVVPLTGFELRSGFYL